MERLCKLGIKIRTPKRLSNFKIAAQSNQSAKQINATDVCKRIIELHRTIRWIYILSIY